jgi:hypothetical protein
MYSTLGALVDVVHALAMALWGLGLPLLFFRRWRRVSRAYMWYAFAFVVVSQGSHSLFGECALTTFARQLRALGAPGSPADHAPFTVRLVNFVAGLRPSAKSAVLAWEVAILATVLGLLWHGRAERAENQARGKGQRPGAAIATSRAASGARP